ncbi:MAG TPA: hypothetical protein VLF90_04675 [Patescibacteria group bacterium]|nr:hypothetical protein [Patescibacteria group bacterium]
MAEAHRFSPIQERGTLYEALDYIADSAGALSKHLVGVKLPFDTLTLFAHYNPEHEFIDSVVRNLGNVSTLSHESTLYVKPRNLIVRDHRIKLLGVRVPDPDRPQVGYVDFPVSDSGYKQYKTLQLNNRGITEIYSASGTPIIELRDNDSDVLGYIVKESSREKTS